MGAAMRGFLLLISIAHAAMGMMPIIPPMSPPTRVGKADLGAVGPEQRTDFTITLKIPEDSRRKLAETVKAVSDPRSPEYGHYLDQEQVNAMTAPREEDVQAVEAWLKEHDIHGFTHSGDNIRVQTTAAKAQALFQTPVHAYEVSYSNGRNERVERLATKPSLPPDVRRAVQLITGI